MKKFLKYILIILSFNTLFTTTSVLAKNKNNRFYDINYNFYIDKNRKIDTYEDESFYKNLGNLAVYYIFENIPNITNETKKNIILSKNRLNSNKNFFLKNFLILDEDVKKIENHMKTLKEKIKNENKKDANKHTKNTEKNTIKYFKKLINNKNINIEKIKQNYIKIIKEKIDELQKNIKNSEDKLKEKTEKNFFIEFSKKIIYEEKEKSEENNILEKNNIKSNEELLKKGRELVKKDIKYKKLFIDKLKKDIKEIKKIEKKYLETFLINILTEYSNNQNFLQKNLITIRYKLYLYFKNTYKLDKATRYIFLRYFEETLYEELIKLKNNVYIKNYFKEKEKELNETIKQYQKDYKVNKSESKTFYKHLRYLNKSIFDYLAPKHPFDYPIISGYLDRLDIYSENNEKILDIIIKIITSNKFKEKLKNNLTEKRVEKIKNTYLHYLYFMYKYTEKKCAKIKKENSIKNGKKEIEQTIKYQKEWLDRAKEINDEQEIKMYNENIKYDKEILKDEDLLREKGNMSNQISIDAYDNTKKQIKYTIKKIKNTKLIDIKNAQKTIKLDKICKDNLNDKNLF